MAGFPITMNAKVARVATWVEGDEVKNIVVFDLNDGEDAIELNVDDVEEYRAALIERLPIVLSLDVPKLTPQY